MDQDWVSDLQRAGGSRRALLREQSLWAIWVYRFGRRVDARRDGVRKKCLLSCYWALHRMVETLTGIGLPKAAQIGPGLRIWHFGGIFIHPGVVMGANCTLRQGVTLGDKGDGGGRTRVWESTSETDVLEKAGVNFSSIFTCMVL